jgi:flagellar biosynthetic protein FliP
MGAAGAGQGAASRAAGGRALARLRELVSTEYARQSRFAELLRASHRRSAQATLVVFLLGSAYAWHSAWAQAGGAGGGAPAAAAKPAAGGADTLSLKLPDVKLEVGGGKNGSGDAGSLIQVMVLFTLLTLAPSIVIMMTPFTRIVIVLGLLRNALGTQQSPPNSVLVGLALFLSLFVMMPVLTKINTDALQPYLNQQLSTSDALARGQAPLRKFMLAQTRDKDLALFVEMAKLDVDKVKLDDVPLHVVIPAFMISELKTAFQLGFVIYLPFLVVDMVVASILMSMGMLMLPPVLISLPFKLLMFVLSDGWHLIFGSLVRSFRV